MFINIFLWKFSVHRDLLGIESDADKYPSAFSSQREAIVYITLGSRLPGRSSRIATSDLFFEANAPPK